ncbi:hypothetical protein [Myxococcus stipitatus]|uniref:hypothetical protein n=1 Tax=Myxococcus stipitatus TaxID=83455 RepID=UPI0030CBE710
MMRPTLDGGKILVLRHPDAKACQALSEVIGCQVKEGAPVLMVSRDLKATTPSCYLLTALDSASPMENIDEQGSAEETTRASAQSHPSKDSRAEAPSPAHEAPAAQRDWASAFDIHRQPAKRSVGGPGLIPPSGVLYGIRTLTQSYTRYITNFDDWSAASGKSQTAEFGFTSSFYVYRENGKANADYVVIRVQEATFNPSTFMVYVDNAKAFWQYHFQTECTNNRSTAALSTSPGTTNGPVVGPQISVPLHVKYVQEGSCVPNYWSASHGPVGRTIEGWALLNQSSNSAGTARWHYHHREFWNSQNEPPDDFGNWWSKMYEGGYGGKVKTLSALARSAFTVETLSAWRFSASAIGSNPNVTFTESLNYRLAGFANPKGTGRNHRIIWATSDRSASITINLVSTTDISSPCK